MSQTCEKCGNALDGQSGCQFCLISLGLSQGAEQSELDQKLASLPSIEDLNDHFPQLQITRLVGRGGMGAIYHARQTTLERDVALKIIAKEVAGDTAFIERFEREAKTLARLSHPNIVTIFDFGRTIDGQAYLIMEFIDGINLREAMASKSIDRNDSLSLISTICKALEYAHSKGVVHRDIKPENILLGEDGTVKVADFGIAKIVDNSVHTPTLTATRQVLGSLHYLAPEHLESPNQVDHRVDLYALGVIFYELLTEQLPLGRYEPPSRVRGGIDARLDPIVMKTLSRQPSERYQSAAALESDLQPLGITGNVAPQLSPDSIPQVQSNLSVPFTLDTFAGLAQSVGRVRAVDGQLRIEHRLQDSIFGAAKSKTGVISIPIDSISELELIPGAFSSRLLITTDSINALDDLPGAQPGQAELKIRRADNQLAIHVVRELGFSSSQPHRVAALAEASAAGVVKSHAGWTTFAVFMIFCGIVNAGLLGIAQVFIVDELRHNEMIAATVGAAILFGPVSVIQLVTGLLCLVARPIGVARAAAVVSMIPVTPGWLLSFPIGLWAYRWLRYDQTPQPGTVNPIQPAAMSPANVETTDVSQSMLWSTTSLFIPESRWGRRLLAIGNATAAAVAIGAFATFKLGLYPTTMNYRVVDSSVSAQQLLNHVEQRLHSLGDVRPVYRNRDRESLTRFEISLTAKDRDAVREALAIEGSVRICSLVAGPLPDDRSGQEIGIAPGLDLPEGLADSESNLRPTATAMSKPIVIESSFVSKVNLKDQALTLRLSEQGQEALISNDGDDKAFAGLGLIVDGQLEAFASVEEIEGRKLVFTLSEDSQATAAALAAAIRGPVLTTALELLED